MSLCEKFIVMPFKKVRGNIAPGEMRQASNSATAERLAGAMARRLARQQRRDNRIAQSRFWRQVIMNTF